MLRLYLTFKTKEKEHSTFPARDSFAYCYVNKYFLG